VLSVALASSAWAERKVLRISYEDSPTAEYVVALLRMALPFSNVDYQLDLQRISFTVPRLIEEIKGGNFDLMWTATNNELEEQLLPIRVPLYKGLLGHRVFIIHPSLQSRFDQVDNLLDLQRFSLGQGRGWSDVEILEANDLKVTVATKYGGLFHMVEGGRFDAFPRGVQEPWQELQLRPELQLTVEEKLLLVYKMPYYLFTGRDNRALAIDLEATLIRAIEAGAFDEFFFSYPQIKDVISKANLAERKVFPLVNPQLPPKTPVDNPILWLDAGKLKEKANAQVEQAAGADLSSLY
jgi:hypothetical protein